MKNGLLKCAILAGLAEKIGGPPSGEKGKRIGVRMDANVVRSQLRYGPVAENSLYIISHFSRL